MQVVNVKIDVNFIRHTWPIAVASKKQFSKINAWYNIFDCAAVANWFSVQYLENRFIYILDLQMGLPLLGVSPIFQVGTSGFSWTENQYATAAQSKMLYQALILLNCFLLATAIGQVYLMKFT
jgi:hypothetical protein